MAADDGEVLDPLDTDGISQALQGHGFCVIRQLFPTATVERARAHLEAAVERHLSSAVAAGAIDRMPAELPLEERIAAAYAHAPENAPASWVSAIRTAPAFHHHLFRDAALCSVVKRLTGREPCVAARYNCRCKLKAAAGAAFPWHQDHAFFRMQYALRGETPRRLLAAWAPLTEVRGALLCHPLCHRHRVLTTAAATIPSLPPGRRDQRRRPAISRLAPRRLRTPQEGGRLLNRR